MNLSVTQRQKQTLAVIYNYIKKTGYPPTFEEMKDGLSVSSNQSILDLLNKLEVKRVIKRGDSARSITILPYGYEILGKPPLVPFLGISHAGAPIQALQIDGEWQQMPGEVSKLQGDVYLIKVSGDSMINAGINDGTIVLIKEQKEFVSGDIVLADIGGDSAIKRFISQDKPPYLFLKPENPSYPIIHFTSTVEMKGKVISILKSGQWLSIN